MKRLRKARLPIQEGEDEVVYMNDIYQVHVRKGTAPGFGRAVHLGIRRLDREPIHDWRDLQWIKNQLCGAEAEGVELYPAESRLVDGANQYHLFVFLEFKFPFGFDERLVTESLVESPYGKSKQRPFADHVRPADLRECEKRLRIRLKEAERKAERDQVLRSAIFRS